MDRTDTILIYAINRTDAWWKHIGDNLGFTRSVVVTDIRGKGDCDVIDDFYAAYRRQQALADVTPAVLSMDEVLDVIARCRLLRWLPPREPGTQVPAAAPLPSLDAAAGQRLAGDYAEAYERALAEFARLYGPGGEGHAALTGSDPKALAAALHALRGAAATIGALPVQALALDCESALAHGRPLPLAALHAELEGLQRTLGEAVN